MDHNVLYIRPWSPREPHMTSSYIVSFIAEVRSGVFMASESRANNTHSVRACPHIAGER